MSKPPFNETVVVVQRMVQQVILYYDIPCEPLIEKSFEVLNKLACNGGREFSQYLPELIAFCATLHSMGQSETRTKGKSVDRNALLYELIGVVLSNNCTLFLGSQVRALGGKSRVLETFINEFVSLFQVLFLLLRS